MNVRTRPTDIHIHTYNGRIGTCIPPFPMCLPLAHTILSFSWTGRDGEYLYRHVFTSAGSRPFLLCCRRREMRTRTGTGSRRVAFGAAAHLDFLTFDLFTFTTFTSLQSPSNTSYPTYLTYLTNQLFHTRPQWRPRAPTATTTTDTPSHP